MTKLPDHCTVPPEEKETQPVLSTHFLKQAIVMYTSKVTYCISIGSSVLANIAFYLLIWRVWYCFLRHRYKYYLIIFAIFRFCFTVKIVHNIIKTRFIY